MQHYFIYFFHCLHLFVSSNSEFELQNPGNFVLLASPFMVLRKYALHNNRWDFYSFILPDHNTNLVASWKLENHTKYINIQDATFSHPLYIC
jgi:isoprenylcysteine carboxyl methyltransferase (ICMT) family protein YpbQ